MTNLWTSPGARNRLFPQPARQVRVSRLVAWLALLGAGAPAAGAQVRPDETTVLDSSKALRQRLADKGRHDLPVRTVPPDDLDRLTAPDLAAHVAAQLGPTRELADDEQDVIAEFWRRHAPLRGPATVKALQDAVAAKGRDRHIDFYLEAVRQAHWGLRP